MLDTMIANARKINDAEALRLLAYMPSEWKTQTVQGDLEICDFLDAVIANPTRVTAFRRTDDLIDGLIIEGFEGYTIKRFHDEGCECDDVWDKVLELLRWDERIPEPDEIDITDAGVLRLWWDCEA